MWRRRAKRFHLLLLDNGETFVEDHAVQFYPSEQFASLLGLRAARFWRGRIHCASSSITFEPEDPEVPLLRVLLSEVVAPLAEWSPSGGTQPPRASANPWDSGKESAVGEGGFVCCAGCVLHKRENNQPFTTLRLAQAEPLRFVLLHTRCAAFLELMLPVQRSLADRRAQAQLQAVWSQKQQNKSFDLTGLVDPLETHLLELRVQRVRPMVNTAAILLLTESRLYLQVRHTVQRLVLVPSLLYHTMSLLTPHYHSPQDCFSSDSAPLTHWNLSSLLSIAARRRRTGIGSDGVGTEQGRVNALGWVRWDERGRLNELGWARWDGR